MAFECTNPQTHPLIHHIVGIYKQTSLLLLHFFLPLPLLLLASTAFFFLLLRHPLAPLAFWPPMPETHLDFVLTYFVCFETSGLSIFQSYIRPFLSCLFYKPFLSSPLAVHGIGDCYLLGPM